SAVIVGCLLLVRVDGLSLSRVSPRRFALVSIGSLLLAIPQAMLAAVYWAYIGGATPSPGFSMSSAAVLVISWMLVDSGIRGIFEEIVFRGFLQPALVRRYEAHPEGQYTAVVATTFLFVLIHVYGIADLRLLPYMGFLSLCYGYLALKTGLCTSSALLHVTHNVAALWFAHSGLWHSAHCYLSSWFNEFTFAGPTLLILLAILIGGGIHVLRLQWEILRCRTCKTGISRAQESRAATASD